jgi:hypothetical protein
MRARALVSLTGLGVAQIFFAGCATPRKAASAPPAAPPSAEPVTAEKPRPHHYVFAHRALPQIFFRNTDSLFLRTQNGPADEVRAFWEIIGRSLPEADRLPADQLTAEYRPAADSSQDVRMVVVTLPPALIPPEALYAVLAIRGRERFYLTYERSAPLLELKPVAVLCGWDATGNHLNHGLVGDLTRESFEKLLTQFFHNRPAPAADAR